MALLRDLPVELLTEIIYILFYDHDDETNPLNVLCINLLFKDLVLRLLYTHLRFRSTRQLSLFSQKKGPEELAYRPKTLTVTLAGGAADFDVFRQLAGVLKRCGAVSAEASENGNPKQVELDVLSLCLHSHERNPHLRYIYDALSLVNPKEFEWTGPDPDHHFSTAIVPTATLHLFRAMSTWTNIHHITITNLSFPSDDLGLHTSFSYDKPLLPALPTLRTLYLGQATLLRPGAVAAMISIPGQDNLESIRLVDAYRESIWGPRIRRGDVERAAMGLGIGIGNKKKLIERVRKLVRCEARTERIMGGDRVEGLASLD